MTEAKGDEDYLYSDFLVFSYYYRNWKANISDKGSQKTWPYISSKRMNYWTENRLFKSQSHTHIYMAQVLELTYGLKIKHTQSWQVLEDN